MNILTQFKDILIESLKENKKWIIGLYALFIICFIASWMLSSDQISTLINSYNITPSVNLNTNTSVTPIDLFIKNESGGIIVYLTSILFSIPAFISIIYNGINLGMMGQLFSQLTSNGGLLYIIYLIPHGIFEFTATVIQSVAGIQLFSFIWNFIKAMRSDETNGMSESFDKTKKILIQSIVLMIFATILLLIAAPIESYFSFPFAQFVIGS